MDLTDMDFSLDIAPVDDESHADADADIDVVVDADIGVDGSGQNFLDTPNNDLSDSPSSLHPSSSESHSALAARKDKPYLSVKHKDFKDICESRLPTEYTSLEDFMLNGKALHLKEFLEAVANPDEVAEALHRLRIIMGITEYDPKTKYELHYIMSYCTLEGLTSDTENLITQTMKSLVEELFIDSFYLLECDVEIDVLALPANLTAFEKEWILSHRVGGVRMRAKNKEPGNTVEQDDSGSSGIFERLQAYLIGDRIMRYDAVSGEELRFGPEEEEKYRLKQWELMRDWLVTSPEIENLPHFNKAEFQFKALEKEEFQKEFLRILQTIESELGPALDSQLQSESQILLGLGLLKI